MVRKKLAVAIAALGALQADVVSALGMGEFSLKSALNQPLNAEIRLLNIDDLDASQVLVKMAPQADFTRAGVGRDFFLTNIKFNVEVDGAGNGVIKVTTREPVVEPYLNFLVETRWPSGRMLREYTVLLDLPVFSDSDAAAVAAPVSSSTSATAAAPATVSARPAVRSSPATATRSSYSEGELVAGDQYRVKNDDTLWEIAQNSRPGSDVSIQQAMVGIQRLNPEAFVNGNINRLKAGSVLRLPTRDEISVSTRQAIGEVANQNRAWKQGDESMTPAADVQLDATATDSTGSSSYEEGARLSIASGGESDNLADGDGASSAGGRAAQEALAAAEETLDKTTMENQELQSRLSDMEAKLATLQRLIELKDDQLAAMQAEGAGDQSATMSDMDDEQDVAAAEQDAATTVASPPKPAPAPKPAEDGLLDQLQDNLLYVGAAGLGVLAIAVVLLMRRRKEEEPDDLLVEYDQEPVEVFDEVAEQPEAGLEVAEADDEDDTTEQLVAELESEIAADNADEALASTGQDESSGTGTAIQSETGDAIAEADIYVAYGRYQQAIDLLRSAAEQEPERADIQLKLLEVYVETRDKPAFQQQYQALQALGDDSAIEQVKEMLSTVDGVSDWLDGMPDNSSGFSDADMDADLIEGDADDASLAMDDIELDLDEDLAAELDLDLDLDDLTAEPTQEVLAVADDTLSLDDDLDLTELDDDIADGKTVQFDVAELEEQLASTGLELDDELTAEQPAADNGDFELDLDEELDLDALGDTDIGDLEAEFGDLGEVMSPAAGDNSLPADDLDLGEEVDLGDLSETLEVEDTLDQDAKPTVQYSLDDVAAEASGAGSAEGDVSGDLEELAAELDEDATTVRADLVSEPAVEPPAAATPEQSFDDIADDPDAGEDDFDFLADTDEVATKLDLARAYIDMGDAEGAKDILDEVIGEGSDTQVQEAKGLMEKMD